MTAPPRAGVGYRNTECRDSWALPTSSPEPLALLTQELRMPRLARIRFSLALLVAALGCREDAESPSAPVPAPALVTSATPALAFYQMSAGNDHTCGVTTDNRAFCWGFVGLSGPIALGDGSSKGSPTPVAVVGGLQFRQVSAGYYSTCGVTTDYRAYCWGDNGRGELGDGTTTERLRPVAVAGGHHFRQVDVSFQHTCGVSYPDHGAYCWGDNAEGQLGDGSRTIRLTPAAVTGTLAFRQVTAGYNHTCGVTTDNQAFCWGNNRVGQIGDSTTVFRRVKPTLVARQHQYRQVDAGRDYNCAVTTDDRAFCWGEGRYGQIGNGKLAFYFWPRAVAGGLFFSRVSAGAFHTCGETTANQAYCWGTGGHGELGDGTYTDNQLTPVAVVGGLTFAQVSAGSFQTCGKTPASVAYCWGSNFYGELGDGTGGIPNKSSTPVAVAGPM
jgi:alpha-tubulin suppressor-like RCC1 family protein